ncbi:MAG: hypothetical protein H7X84_12660 [Verrucomicrobia bacterium]|nr:hypothetical protein [Prolixibacteraceae bacterium]
MAKILNRILGGFSGKVGTVVGACWKGIDHMRALAKKCMKSNIYPTHDQNLIGFR